MDSEVTGNAMISGMPSTAWRTRASMPTPLAYLGVTAASNGNIYAIGGVGGTVEEYAPATTAWTTRTSMPTPRYFLGVAASSNGKIYAIGGDNGGYLATVEEYDPATDTWTTRTSMPTVRSSLGVAAASNGKIYAIGGVGSGYLATVEEYDPAMDTWTPRASMPMPRMNLGAAAASNGKIYAIGGNDGMGVLATVEEYDPATDTWTTRASMPTPRYYLGVTAASNGKIYAIGGSGSMGALATVEEYDPVTDIWTTRASMPTAREALGVATAINGKVYAIGGHNGDFLGTVEEFDTTLTASVSFNVQNTTIRSGNLELPEDSQVYNSIIGGSIAIAGSTPGYSSTVQNTTVSGGITINGNGTIADSAANGAISLGGGIVENNTITSGGVNISGGSALNNKVTGGGISVSSGGVARDNSVENAPGWGIQASSDATVEYNRVVGCANGIQASDGVVKGNLIANITGIGLQIGSATVEHNTFTGIGGSAIKITSGTPGLIVGNNFEFNTGAYDVENLIPKDTVMMVDARNNWWGTTSGTAIRQRIWDFNDDYNLGTVLYAPVLTAPDTTSPAYIRAITLTPESPVGIQTVAFEVLFSREMDRETANPTTYFEGMTTEWTTYHPENSGLPGNCVRPVFRASDDSIWFGIDCGHYGLARFDGTEWTTYTSIGIDGDINDIAEATNGDIWVAGSWYGGVARFDGSNWYAYTPDNAGLPSAIEYWVATSPDGSI